MQESKIVTEGLAGHLMVVHFSLGATK